VDKKNGKMVFPVGCINSYALGQELAYNAEERVWANPFPPVVIINIIKAKAGESSCVARFTKTVAQEPTTCCAGTWFLHNRSWFLRGTFHKDCGAGTGDMLRRNLVPAQQVVVPAWHVSQGPWRRNRRHVAQEPGSCTTGRGSCVTRFTRTVAQEPATCDAGTCGR